jgi:PQQ-dependent dehydrogenase (s-GDH family)
MRQVKCGLEMPWEITYGPDNAIWATESRGYRVSRINPQTGVSSVILDLSNNKNFTNYPPLSPQGGLMGLALHPNLLTGKPYVYLAYVYRYDGGAEPTGYFFKTKVVRYTYNANAQTLTNEEVMCDTIPGSNDHNGGRMTIANVGGAPYLLYGVGDMGGGQFANANRPNKAQDPTSYEGKILRFNIEPDADPNTTDKWIPNDGNNTFGRAVYSIGHRNPQGIVAGLNGNLYQSEHGPYSDDELNLINGTGRNFGHPLLAGMADGNYNGAAVGAGTGVPFIVNEATNAASLGANYRNPLKSFFPVANATIRENYTNAVNNTNPVPNYFLSWNSIAPSGIDYYNSTAIPDWQNSILITSLKRRRVYRLQLDAAGTAVVSDTIPLFADFGRFRDVCISPDGTKIYVSCDSEGQTSGPTAGTTIDPPNKGCILEFTYAPIGSDYCASKSSAPWNEWISNVSLNTINNTSEKTRPDRYVAGYSDWTDKTTTLNIGQSYPLSITASLGYIGNLPQQFCRVWIDFDGDKNFEDAEMVLERTNSTPFASTIVVPASAKIGTTRMRVSLKNGGYPTACESFPNGEVEDYTINIASGTIVDNTCRYQDSLQLVSLYNATNGANWTNKWNLNQPMTTWFGVGLNPDGCVKVVVLPSNNLVGTIPNLNLANIEVLGLQKNVLSGTIPNFIMPKLNNLTLNLNQLTGTIPNLNLPNLQVFDASINQLTGSIPNFNLPNITLLYLYNNQLTGSIPDLSTPKLETLVLDGNKLSGCLPESLRAFCGKTVSFDGNPNLATQNFFAFCNNSTGACNTTPLYCISKSIAPWEYAISNVRLSTMSNNSDKFKDISTLGYSDCTTAGTILNRGQTYPLSITPLLSWIGNLPNTYCRVWIDFDGDKNFEASELVLEKTNQNPFTQSILVPNTAVLGTTRMRVSVKNGAYPTACEAFEKGEVEDYTVQITEGGQTLLPDLTLANLMLPPNAIQEMELLKWKVDIKNIGTGNAPSDFSVKAYISTDNVLSADDRLYSNIPTGNYNAGFLVLQVSDSTTTPRTIPIGQYYLIAKVDADSTIAESNENNNVLVSATKFTVIAAGGGQTATDIALSISTAPSVYKPYTRQNFVVTARNTGNTAFSNVKIKFTRPALTNGGGAKTPSIGTFQDYCSNGLECSEWTIPTLAAGTTATLDAPVFVLNPTGAITATAILLSSVPADNSTTNNTASISVNSASSTTTQPLSSRKPAQLIPIVIQKIYPSPTDSYIEVSLTSTMQQSVEFSITNSMGQTVLIQPVSVEKGVNKAFFDVSALPQGMYLIQTNEGQGRGVPTKFIKL